MPLVCKVVEQEQEIWQSPLVLHEVGQVVLDRRKFREQMANLIPQSQKIISTVADKCNRAILFYSGGKDSIALLDLMHPYFDEILLVFMYFVKDLEHINKYLIYAKERYPNVKVLQVPHWNLSYIRQGGVFCQPEPQIKLLTIKDIDNSIRERYGYEWSFYGMKKSDGLNRRMMLKDYEMEAISTTNRVYPLSNWKQGDVLAYIQSKGLPMPISYVSKKKSQGLGFNIDCYLYLQKHYPQDLYKILQRFPLSEKLLIDHQKRLKNGKS